MVTISISLHRINKTFECIVSIKPFTKTTEYPIYISIRALLDCNIVHSMLY